MQLFLDSKRGRSIYPIPCQRDMDTVLFLLQRNYDVVFEPGET